MKVLSIRQPWASLIVDRVKDIENRTWETPFRGDFLVHATKWTSERQFYAATKPHSFRSAIETSERIIGQATLVDCVRSSRSSLVRRARRVCSSGSSSGSTRFGSRAPSGSGNTKGPVQ